MTVSYDTLLRDKLGGPIVNDKLWRLVASVGEGDAYAYSHALLAIDWVTWRDFESREYDKVQFRWASDMLRDRRLPGGALETLFSNGRVCNGFRADLAAHPNITESGWSGTLCVAGALLCARRWPETRRLAATL